MGSLTQLFDFGIVAIGIALGVQNSIFTGDLSYCRVRLKKCYGFSDRFRRADQVMIEEFSPYTSQRTCTGFFRPGGLGISG